MERFINIKTQEVWEFESWQQIIEKGGLKSCLPVDQWKDIWHEKALQIARSKGEQSSA